MDLEYHYPPDLFQLLVDTIPLLCKSKRDVLTFFSGVGVNTSILEDLRQQVQDNRGAIRKYDIVQTVLARLNEQRECTLAQRRLVLQRVIEWENFSTCYPDNQERARQQVQQVAHFVGSRDAATRVEEIERSRKKLDYLIKQNEVQQRKRELLEVQNALTQLFRMTNAQVRGKLLEGVLNQYFKISGLLVREAFTLTGPNGSGIVEQIDGAAEIDSVLYIIEMKWWQQPIGVAEVSQHISRLYCRSQANGIFISASGYTSAAVSACKEALHHKLIILCELQEFVQLLEQERLLKEFFNAKRHAAVFDKNPLYYPLAVHNQ